MAWTIALVLNSRNDSSGTNFYAFDPQGSTAERVDSSGTLVSSDCYNAWGTIATTASAAVVFGYIAQWGYYTDAETGLVLCTHRYYDPAHGRWLNRDPIGYVGGIDVYAYCDGSPVGQADPTGQNAIVIGIIVVIVVAGIWYVCSKNSWCNTVILGSAGYGAPGGDGAALCNTDLACAAIIGAATSAISNALMHQDEDGCDKGSPCYNKWQAIIDNANEKIAACQAASSAKK